MTASTVDVTSERGSIRTIGHALHLAPEFRAGLPVTLLLTMISTAGRVVVPLAVQQTIDHGLAKDNPDFGLVRTACLLAFAAVVITAVANYLMNVRLYRTTENGLLS